MLVLRGHNLPAMTAVFPVASGLRGVFICSRPDPIRGGHAWLVSDPNSSPYSPGTGAPGSNDPAPERAWIRTMLESLRLVAPRLFHKPYATDLEAALYTGLTSERELGGGIHRSDFYVDTLGLRNLAAVWPTKLTFTPLASNVGVRMVQNEVPSPSGPWTSGRQPTLGTRPAIAREMWTRAEFTGPTCSKTGWQAYPKFATTWDIAEVS